jgi:hypothetical protein
MGGYTLMDWQSSTQTSFEKVQNSNFANQANVRLQISFMRDIPTLENRIIYTVFDFFASVVCFPLLLLSLLIYFFSFSDFVFV